MLELGTPITTKFRNPTKYDAWEVLAQKTLASLAKNVSGKQTVSEGVAPREWFDHRQVIRRKPRAKQRKVARGRAG